MKNYNNYRVLILGAPGSGKSTLLKLLSYHTVNKECTEIIHGYNIRDFDFGVQNDCPLFIDSLDEMQNSNEFCIILKRKIMINWYVHLVLICLLKWILRIP